MNGSELKQLILCADDFGIAPGVNRAILQLIDAGRLNATSCMTSMPDWSNDASRLRPFTDRIQIGLHLTLTDQKSLAPLPKLAPSGQLPNLGTLLKKSITRQLDFPEILEELQRQYDAFYQEVGRPPDFVDGHQHVHQFPIIRDAVIELINRNSSLNSPWVRICWESPTRLALRRESIGRALSIGMFGLSLRRATKRNNISHNPGFTGVYDYRSNSMTKDLMLRLLRHATEGTVMFCHPGIVDAHLARVDELTEARETEYEFFQSAEFSDALATAGFALFPDRRPPSTND